jgi:hypothetical protein
MTEEDLKKLLSIKKQLNEVHKNASGFVAIYDWGIHLTTRGFLDLFPNGDYAIHEHTLSFPKTYEASVTRDGEQVFCLIDEITKRQLEGEQI